MHRVQRRMHLAKARAAIEQELDAQGFVAEPLDPAFSGVHLWTMSRGRAAAVKTFLMDQKTVVGVGNIYAAEALFAAGIRPGRAAGSISLARYERLAVEIKRILAYAITRGGTTLRDFQAIWSQIRHGAR